MTDAGSLRPARPARRMQLAPPTPVQYPAMSVAASLIKNIITAATSAGVAARAVITKKTTG